MVFILAVGTTILFFSKKRETIIYGTISGYIVAEDTGEGLENVEVLLYIIDKNGSRQLINQKKTDKNGKVNFTLVKGEYILFFVTEMRSGYYADIPWEEVSTPGEKVITLEKGKHVEVKRKALVGGTALIKINKRDGTKFIAPPDKELNFLTVGEVWGFMSYPDETDEEGVFIAKGIPPDVYRFEVSIEGHTTRKIENIKIEKGKTTEIEFIIDFSDPTGIEGKVISSIDGGPITGAHIAIYTNEEGISHFRMAPDEAGYFSIVGLAQGKYRIWCKGKSFRDISVTQGKKTWIELKLDIPSPEKNVLYWVLFH